MERLVFGYGAAQPSFDPSVIAPRTRDVILYTDAFVVRGTLQARARRLSDALNASGEPFLVLEQVSFEAHGTGQLVERAEFAQVNLSTVLFAYEPGDQLETPPELRTVKVAQPALISLPPFRLVGDIHVLPERDLRQALVELLGRFVPLTAVTFSAPSLGVPRTGVAMVAFNHARSQILAPFTGETEDAPGLSG
ncbi:MAG: hypothetical protein ACP5VP_04835 [Candidatus Limnocylindrales bacterium]